MFKLHWIHNLRICLVHYRIGYETISLKESSHGSQSMCLRDFDYVQIIVLQQKYLEMLL